MKTSSNLTQSIIDSSMSYGDLPRISIVEDERSYCSTDCDCCKKSRKKVEDEDRRLANWELWVKRRQEVGEKIRRVVKRNPGSLVMNTEGNFRTITEFKLMLNNASISVPEKYEHINPGFFKIPAKLRRICCEEQRYYSQLTKEDKRILTEVEYVGKSTFITEKMGVENKRKFNWCKNEYFQKKIRSVEMKSLDYFRPDISALALIANSLPTSFATPKPLDAVIEASSINTLNEEYTREIVRPEPTLLLLNNIPVIANDTKNIRLIFTDFSQPEVLIMENKTKYALRFYFQEEQRSFYLIPEIKHKPPEQAFYFNKNTHIIKPDERLDFPFWFKSKQVKSHVQTLKMIIVPSMFKKISVTLQATSCNSNDFYEKCVDLMSRLEGQIQRRVIKEVMEELIQKVAVDRPKTIQYKYDKAMIFEAVNSKLDPFKCKPTFFYDTRVVGELEKFYSKVRLEHHPEFWDLKIETLRLVTKERELFEEETSLEKDFDVITAKVAEAVLKRQELKAKPAKPAGVKAKKKKDVKKKGSKRRDESPGEKSSFKVKAGLGDELEAIIGELRAVCGVSKVEEEGRVVLKVLTNLFSAYFDRIVEDIGELELRLGVSTLVPKIRNQVAMFKGSNESEGVCCGCTIFSQPFYNWIRKEAHKPKPNWSSEIPLEDYKRRYKAFHSISEVSTKKSGKNSKHSKKGKKNHSLESPATLPSRSSRNSGRFPRDVDSMQINEEDVLVFNESFEKYADDTYVIFYTNLCGFFEDFEGVMETYCGAKVPSLGAIKDLEEESGSVVKVDGDVEVRIFDLKRAISEALGAPRNLVMKREEAKTINISDSSSSIWTILDAYKEKVIRFKPRFEGDLFYVLQDRGKETVDTSLSMIVLEEDLDKSAQVDVCTSEEVSEEVAGIEEELCVCSSSITSSVITADITYYDSCADFDRSVSATPEDIQSCKSSET